MMIHWGFLILAFIVGAAACYGFIWYIGGAYAQRMEGFVEGAKSAWA